MWPPVHQQPMRDSAPTPCRKNAKSPDSAKPKRLPEKWSCFDRGQDPTRKVFAGVDVLKKVLIVDDSVSMRQMVGFTLREGGFEVIEAEHGQDALDKLKGGAVDMVI